MPRMSLLEANDAYYLNGDRSKLEQYERELREEQEAQRKEKEAGNRWLALGGEYNELGTADGYNAMQRELDEMQQTPTFQQLSGHRVKLPSGEELDLAHARVAAERARNRRGQ